MLSQAEIRLKSSQVLAEAVCRRQEARTRELRQFYPQQETIFLRVCVIHGDSLLPDGMCFLCQKKYHSRTDFLILAVTHCAFCHRLYRSESIYCSTCWICAKCNLLTRLPGFCSFCGTIFQLTVLRHLRKQDWFLSFLVEQTGEFIGLNRKGSKLKHIIDIILYYL
jgi:hypothetical protein